jgi:hypothetical protein
MSKSHRAWEVILVACTASFVVLQPVRASAVRVAGAQAPAASPQFVLRSVLDGVSLEKPALANLASAFRSGCTSKREPVQAMGLGTALAGIEAQLNDNASAKALQGFATSADARSVAGASDFVIGAVAAGKPWAAVDALLRVHQLDPGDAGVLISLAGLVTTLGMPQEGLALLGAAAKAPADKQTPMGIDYQAVALNNRGYALLELGYPKEAEGYLQSAEQQAPLLSEARDNLDAAQQCAWVLGGGGGQPPVIADPPFWREDQPGDWTTGSDGNAVPVASSIFDLSQGVAWTPIQIELPDSPAQGEAMVKSGYYTSLNNQIVAQIRSDGHKSASLKSQVYNPNEETMVRRDAIWAAHYAADWQPEVKPLYQEYESIYNALQNALVNANGSLDPVKPSLDASHQCLGRADYDTCYLRACTSETAEEQARWRAQAAAVVNAELRYENAYWDYETGLAADVADPADHELQIIDAQDTMLGETANVLGQVFSFVNAADSNPSCTGTAKAAPAAESLPSQNASKACPKALHGMKASLKADGFFALSITCEEVEVEVGTGPIGAFTSVSYNPHEGNVTVFTGGKLEAGPASGKVGGYVTVGASGVVDAGMRVQSELSAGAEEVATVSRTNTINLSIAGTTPFNPEGD